MQQSSDQEFEPISDKSNSGKRGERGFAAMDPAQQKSIASKGGQAVSQNREHMSEIGRKGGEAVSQNREHMSAIGRKGGEAGGKTSR
jgi:hypothetical protein